MLLPKDYIRYRLTGELALHGAVRRIAENAVWLERGEVFAINSLAFFALGGAMMEGYRPVMGADGRPLWPVEIPMEKERAHALATLARVNWRVDIVLTHDGPEGVIPARPVDPLRPFLKDIAGRLRFRKWYFGHHHKDFSQGRYQCVFASILPLEELNQGDHTETP